MANGRTFGRFKNPDAYSIMTRAKKAGARKQAQEDYEKYSIALSDWMGAQSKWNTITQLGDYAGMAGAKGLNKHFKGLNLLAGPMKALLGFGLGQVGSVLGN